jgi:peptidoglycan/xylan/chitin deacetylase (PgdA/CDA1 family)
MLRGFVKTGAAIGLHRTGLLPWASRRRSPRDVPRVVGYHRVVEDFHAAATGSLEPMLISRRMLERHLEWMARRFRFITLAEVGMPEGACPPKRPPIAVTFDDGYRDFYHHAFPTLKAMGVPAGLFVVSSLLGTSRLQLHDRLFLRLREAFRRWHSPLRELRRVMVAREIRPYRRETRPRATNPASLTRMLLRSLSSEEAERLIEGLQEEIQVDERLHEELMPLSWEMLSEMARAGITIGSHSRSHPCLPNEPPQKIREEIEGSRRELEGRLSMEITDFAYPDGQFDDKVVDAVAEAGYTRAYSACQHRHPRHAMLTIPRQLLWERSSVDGRGRFSEPVMRCQMEWIFGASDCQRGHGLPAAG